MIRELLEMSLEFVEIIRNIRENQLAQNGESSDFMSL